MLIGYKTIFIAALIGVLPALLAGVLYFFGKKPSVANFNLLLKIFFWGVLTAIPASVFQIINIENHYQDIFLKKYFSSLGENSFEYAIFSFLLVALIEEGAKAVGIFFSLKSLARSSFISKLNPGILVGVMIGLAFGVTENGVYFANNFVSRVDGGFISVVFLRFLLSTSAHMIYSGLFGVFLFDLMLANGFLKKFFYFFALLLPVAIHTGFNLLVSSDNFGVLSIPWLLVGLAILLFKML